MPHLCPGDYHSDMLAPTLGTLPALYRNLEREQYRALHHTDLIHKADHFLNFCITAPALRDYFLDAPLRGSCTCQFSGRLPDLIERVLASSEGSAYPLINKPLGVLLICLKNGLPPPQPRPSERCVAGHV